MNMKFFHIILMLGLAVGVQAQTTITVDANGQGDYTTIQAAVNAVAEGAEATIYVKAGIYEEMVFSYPRTSVPSYLRSFKPLI